MSDKKDLKPRGIVQPKGNAWLKEVKVDAARAAIEHVTRQLEKKEFERQKARGLTVEDMTAQAKKRLSSLEDFGVDDADEFEDDDFEEELEKEKPINQMTKTQLLEVAKEERVDVPEGATRNEVLAAIQDSRKDEE